MRKDGIGTREAWLKGDILFKLLYVLRQIFFASANGYGGYVANKKWPFLEEFYYHSLRLADV